LEINRLVRRPMNRINNERILLRSIILFSLFTLGAVAVIVGSDEPASPAEDGTLDALKSITGQAMMDSYAYAALEELSDHIGGRVSGTPAAARAVDWGIERMKGLGLVNVHQETFMLARGWSRGLAEAEIISPVRRRLRISSLGWVGSTAHGGVEGELVIVNRFQFDKEMKENAAKWASKILLITEKGAPPDEERPQHGIFGKFLKKAHAAHALAVIGTGGGPSAGMQLTHPYSPGWNEYFELPAVSITAEDQWKLERFLVKGDPVRVRIDVQNRVTPGPAESANVVGEIRGREHPEQIIVVGGHLDSWDLAEGTTDDGMGVATTLGAARAITKARLQPRRTLRFVLFTGEEQGLVGSLAYTQIHKDEMVNHVAAVILDIGQGPVTGLNLGGRKDLIPAVQKFADAMRGFAALKVTDDVLFGTDSGPFTLAGLPGIYMSQDSPDYAYTHHTEADTFDKVKQDILARDTAVMALTAYWIADRSERLAVPWPSEQTAKMLIEKKPDGLLKVHDLWPFGEVGNEARKSGPYAGLAGRLFEHGLGKSFANLLLFLASFPNEDRRRDCLMLFLQTLMLAKLAGKPGRPRKRPEALPRVSHGMEMTMLWEDELLEAWNMRISLERQGREFRIPLKRRGFKDDVVKAALNRKATPESSWAQVYAGRKHLAYGTARNALRALQKPGNWKPAPQI